MEYRLPEIPVKPKLFQYKIDYKKSAEYEFSSVEINQDQLINVDYDIGIPLDLIDRDVFLLDPRSRKLDIASA